MPEPEFNILDPMGLFTGAQLAGVPAETLGGFPDELADQTEEMLSRPDVLDDILGDDEILDALEEEDPDILDNILEIIEDDEEGVLGDEADDDETEYLEEMLSILEDEAPEELDALVAEFPLIYGGEELGIRSRARRASRRVRRASRSARRRVSRSVRRRVRRVKRVSRRAVSRARAATRRRIKKIRRAPRRVGRYVRAKARKAKKYVRAKIARRVAKHVGIPTPPTVPGMPAIPTPPGMPAVPGMPAIPGMPGMPAAPGVPGMPTPPEMPVVKFPFPLPPGMEIRDLPAPPGAPKVQVPVPAGTPKLPEPPAMPGAPKLGDENEDEYLEETLDLPEVLETPADEERVARGMLAGKEVSHEEIPIETLITKRPVVTEASELLAEPPEEELLGMGLI